MAILKCVTTGEQIFLQSCHIFGRNPSRSNTLLTNKTASQIHASVRWNEGRWEIQDHSRNGTLLNGIALVGTKKATLGIGDRLHFNMSEEVVWQVENLAPPCAMLLPLHNNLQVIELKRINFLPDDSSPDVSIYISSKGQWVCEDNTEIILLKDGDNVRIGPNTWKFVSALDIDSTIEFEKNRNAILEEIFFRFQASLDEEHIRLKISHQGKTIDMGERIHHYCLLTLARKRLDDAQKGIDPDSQGWIEMDRLSKMLGLDASHLNIQIFRARTQFAQALPEGIGLPNIVERRRGEVRFCAYRFEIMRGSRIEGRFTPAEDLQGERIYDDALSA